MNAITKNQGNTFYHCLPHPEEGKVYVVSAIVNAGKSLGSEVFESRVADLYRFGITLTEEEQKVLGYKSVPEICSKISEFLHTGMNVDQVQELNKFITGYKADLVVELTRSRTGEVSLFTFLKGKQEPGFALEHFEATEDDVPAQDSFRVQAETSIALARAIRDYWLNLGYRVELDIKAK